VPLTLRRAWGRWKGGFQTSTRLGSFVAALLLPAIIAGTAAPAAAAVHNYAALVVDAKTGTVLFSRNADEPRSPASLTKVMTLFILFEELEAGRITLNTRFSVSAYAASQPPTKLGVRAGTTIRVEDAILALVTKSANDVATVVAENISGSEAAFARRMTETAHAIGMEATTFRNPHGLPHSQQVTTARDMVTLGRAVQDRFPQYYRYFSTRSFTFNGVTMSSHNGLLADRGVDGIKTGYTRASGYNILISLRRDNRYVVAVVMGGNSTASRNAHMRELLATHVPRASTGQRTAPLLAQLPEPVPPLPRIHPSRQSGPVVVAMLPHAEGSAGVDAGGGELPNVASPPLDGCDGADSLEGSDGSGRKCATDHQGDRGSSPVLPAAFNCPQPLSIPGYPSGEDAPRC
jgi:D-alanyl-D-alanine carboxypeptidase